MLREEARNNGKVTFNPGYPCIHHPDKIGGCIRYTSNNACTEISKNRTKAAYLADKKEGFGLV